MEKTRIQPSVDLFEYRTALEVGDSAAAAFLAGLVLSGCGFPVPDDAAWQSMGLVFRPQSRREYQCYFLNTGAAGGAME